MWKIAVAFFALWLVAPQENFEIDLRGFAYAPEVGQALVEAWNNPNVRAFCAFAVRKEAIQPPYVGKTYWDVTNVTPLADVDADICTLPGHKGIILLLRNQVDPMSMQQLAVLLEELLAIRPDLAFVAGVLNIGTTPTGHHMDGLVAVRLTPWGMCKYKNECGWRDNGG